MGKRQKLHPSNAPLGSSPPPLAVGAQARLGRWLLLFLPLLFAALLLWRFVLLTPLLDLSRATVEVTFGMLPGAGPGRIVASDDKGNWIVNKSRLFPEQPFTLLAGGLQTFSLPLPIFWALALATGPFKKRLKILGIGTLLLALLSQFTAVAYLLCMMVYINITSPFPMFLLQSAGYCLLEVVPYAAPLVLIIALDRELRSQVFGESIRQIQPTPK